MSNILYRFKQIEQDAHMPHKELEAVQDGDAIVFRQGKTWSCFVGSVFVCITTALGVIFSVGAYSSIPPPGNWIGGGSIFTLMLWLLSKAPSIMASRTLFEVDSKREVITIYPWNSGPIVLPWPRRSGSPHQLTLQDIDYFLCCWDERGFEFENIGGATYAILADGCVHALTPQLDSFDDVEKNTKLLGYICEKSAVSLTPKVKVCDFIEASTRQENNREKLLRAKNINKAKLLCMTSALHIPAQHQ